MSFRRWRIVLGACVLLLLGLGGYKAWQISQLIAFAKSFPEPSETVEPYTVTSVEWSSTVRTVGELKAVEAIALRNEVEGRVVTVGFAPGAAVHKDQLLLQLDASEEIAQLRAAEADAALAGQVLARNSKLIGQKLTSQQEYDQATAQRAVALARAESLRAVIAKKTLTAPFDAQAGLHNLQAGQLLAANTVITQLVGTHSALWVDFALPQQQAGVAIGTPVTVSVRGVAQGQAQGKVTALDSMVSSTSRNLVLRATLDNAAAPFKPGMLVDVAVNTVPAHTVLAVPNTAVLHDLQGSYVFLLANDDKGVLRAKRLAVVAGEEQAGQIVITGGVQAGEQIAANGAYKLQDGMRANVPAKASAKPDVTP